MQLRTPLLGEESVESTLAAVGTSALAVIRECVEGGGRGGWTQVVAGEPGQGVDVGPQLEWIETGLLYVSVYGKPNNQLTAETIAMQCSSWY